MMMNIPRIYGITVLVGVIALGTLSSCSDLRTDLPAASSGALKVHPEGWAVTTAANFHGNAIRAANWDMHTCQTCHGADYRGGTSDVSCRTCHSAAAGPENCTTCHGGANNAPPRDIGKNTVVTARGVGAHQTHVLGTARARQVSCLECHNVPGGVNDPGHVDTPLPAEIQFAGTLSSKATTGTTPAYNAQMVSCGNTYCHGNFKNGNTTYTLVWNAASISAAACGTCHGNPSRPTLAEQALPKTSADGGTHPNNLSCVTCHEGIVDANLKIIAPLKHINGKLNVFGAELEL